jgi:hypothetical protein
MRLGDFSSCSEHACMSMDGGYYQALQLSAIAHMNLEEPEKVHH